MAKSPLPPTPAQVRPLTELTTRGTGAVKTYRRARALLALPAGHSYTAVAAQLGVHYATVSEWAQAFAATGVQILVDKPRRGRPLLLPAAEQAKLTALAGSTAPDGPSQWSRRRLAGKAVERGRCARLSASSAHTTRHSEKNARQPQLKRPWGIGQINGQYLQRLEAVRALYARAYEPRFAVVCVDERPCFLLGDVVEGLAPQPGQPKNTTATASTARAACWPPSSP